MKGENPDSHDSTDSSRFPTERREFLAAGATTGLALAGFSASIDGAQGRVISADSDRLSTAYDMREAAANDFVGSQSLPSHPDNGDADAYADKRGSYIKGLALDHGSPDLGLVDSAAWDSLVTAMESGTPSDFDSIQTGGARELVSPQAGLRYDMVGLDPHQVEMPAAPSFTSDRMASEMAEVYWHALLRDVAFRDYGELASFGEPIPQDAASDLDNNFSDFAGPKENGSVTTDTLFRADLPGCLTGPYISQLLWKPVTYGAVTLDRRINEAAATDYNTSYSTWLEVIEGTRGRGGEYPPTSTTEKSGNQVYIRNGRDLGEYVHANFSYQPYISAALLIYNDMGAPLDTDMPLANHGTQSPYVTFGGAGIFDLVAHAATLALAAGWFHKWAVHLRCRPETYAGRVHNAKNGNASYNISSELLNDSSVLGEISSHNDSGSYLLPAAYYEGSPAHPAYPSGHAIIAGACTTVLKAVFDENYTITDTVQATRDGTSLESLGTDLNLGDELNKLAGNIIIGRDFGGVHYRSDSREGLLAGEQVGHNFLEYELRKTNESVSQLSYTDFEGNSRTITP